MSLPTVGKVGFIRKSRTRELTPVRVIEISADKRTITVQIIGGETVYQIAPDDFLFVTAPTSDRRLSISSQKSDEEDAAEVVEEQSQQRAGSSAHHVEKVKREIDLTRISSLPATGTIGFVRTTRNRQLLPIRVVHVDVDRQMLSVCVLGNGTLFRIESNEFLKRSSDIDSEYRSSAPDLMRTVESDVYRRAYKAYADEFGVSDDSGQHRSPGAENVSPSESSSSKPDSDVVRVPIKRSLSNSPDDSDVVEEAALAEEQIEQPIDEDVHPAAEREINFNQLQSGNPRNDKYRLHYVRQQLVCPDGTTQHRRHILVRASQKIRIEGDDCIVCGFCGYETKRMNTFVTHIRRHHEAESKAAFEQNMRDERPEPFYRYEDDDPV